MGNKAEQRARRRRIREWVEDESYELGGYWYASSVPEERHGQPGTYNNWFCRCRPCTDASTSAKKRERKQRWEERTWSTELDPKGYWYAPNAPEHGLYSTYRNWGCCCPPCRTAEKIEQKESR